MNDDAFIQAILANPDDTSTAQVYADWLEERGDPRGEYLRLEVERLEVAPDDDGRWEIQHRINECRQSIDNDWAVSVALRRIVTIDDLVYYLRHHLRGHYPRSRPLKVPKNLPYALVQIYRQLPFLFRPGEHTFWKQDHLLPPDRLEQVEGMTIFAWENQGCWSCGFPPGQEDPPVYMTSGNGDEIVEVCDSLDHFLITMCLQETIFAAPCLAAFDEGKLYHGKSARELLTVPCRGMNGRYMLEEQQDFFDIPKENAWLMEGGGLWLAAREKTALRLIRKGVKYNQLH
jgi:uncharacterized protein (TIGR02996 family)